MLNDFSKYGDEMESIIDQHLKGVERTEKNIHVVGTPGGESVPYYGVVSRTYLDGNGNPVEERVLSTQRLDDGRRLTNDMKVVHAVCHPKKCYEYSDSLPRCSAEPNEIICFECARQYVYNGHSYCPFHFNMLRVDLAKKVRVFSLGMIKLRDKTSEKRLKQFYYLQNRKDIIRERINRERGGYRDVYEP